MFDKATYYDKATYKDFRYVSANAVDFIKDFAKKTDRTLDNYMKWRDSKSDSFKIVVNNVVIGILFRIKKDNIYHISCVFTNDIKNNLLKSIKFFKIVLEKWRKRYIIRVYSTYNEFDVKWHKFVGFKIIGNIGNEKGALIWE